MKLYTLLLVYIIVCFLLFGCTSHKSQNDSDLIHINLRDSFPEREIRLEEVAYIEFLQLEMRDDFLFVGVPRIVTSCKIIFTQRNSDILVFSRDGSPFSRFNRRGGGSQEFSDLWGIVYDEVTEEIFVQSPNRIMVYSLTGEFKRAIPLLEGSSLSVVNYDAESLLVHDFNNVYPTSFSLISKKDGSIIAAIDMPPITRVNRAVPFQRDGVTWRSYIDSTPFVSYNDGFLLDIWTTDTVFLYRSRELLPFLVRTPKIHSMNPIVILENFIVAGNYQFLDTRKLQVIDGRLPFTSLMRNKITGSMYRPRIIFDELGKEITISRSIMRNNNRLGLISLDLTELQDANDEGRLSGRLREIVENSEEDGNNVFMLLHFK